MCYFLFLASPLTLTEVRAMLPPGVSADLTSYAEQQLFKSLHPAGQTVARLLVGRCSCDLVRQRLPQPREDERHLRERYRALELPRATVIQSLERHRRHGPVVTPPVTGWAGALAGFVAEHARNAGASLFFLHFGRPELTEFARRSIHHLTPSQVGSDHSGWLKEETPTLVR